MEITLLVSPGGSITFHCDHPFTHKLILLSEVEGEIEKLIAQQLDEEQDQEEQEELDELLDKDLLEEEDRV